MKRALILLLLLGFTGCGRGKEMWHNIFSAREQSRCFSEYAILNDAQKDARTSSGLKKIASLQVMQIQTQLLIRDRCCRWSQTCFLGPLTY